MQEYLSRHILSGHWSSITLDRNDTSALIVVPSLTDGTDVICTVSYDTASCLLQYMRQSGDYTVERIV